MCIFGLHCFVMLYRCIGHAITGTHEVPFRWLVENSNFREPLARGRSCPSRSNHSRRETMMLCQCRSIHMSSDQGIGIDRLFEWDTPNEGRHFPWNFVESAKHHVLSSVLDAGFLQKNLQARTRKLRIADRAFAPLNSRNFRVLKRAPIAGTLHGIRNGVDG